MGEPPKMPPNFLLFATNPVKSYRKTQTTLATVRFFSLRDAFIWSVLSVLCFYLRNILKTAPRSFSETFKTPCSASLMGACSCKLPFSH